MKKLLCLLLLILIPFVLADFNVYSKQLIDTCDCSQSFHELTINSQDKADFIIYSKSKWILPIKFSLDKNQFKKINLPVNIPCTIRGEYDVDIIVKSTKTKSFPLTINVKRCPNIEVNVDNYQEACPGKQIKYPIEIKNTGKFKETYSFDLDKYKEYSLIDYRALEIDPGKTAKFNLYLNIPLTFEDINFTFITKTKYSKLTASTPLFFYALPCYKYELNYKENYTLCQDVEENIPITVKNLGDKQTIFFTSKYDLDKDKLELDKGEEDVINIKVKPKIGRYNIILKSKNDIKEKQDEIKLEVKSKRDCYKAEIITEKIKSGKGSFKIKNTGIKEATYSLSIDSDWIKIPGSITLAPDEEKEVNLDIDWKEGRHNFNIKAIANEEEFVQSITLGEFVFHKKIGNFFVNIYNNVKDFIIKNILYVGIAIGVIILLIIILKVITKISQKRLEKELLEEPKVEVKKAEVKIEKKVKKEVKKEKKEVKEKPKKKIKEKPKKPFKFPKLPWKIIIPILIVIIIAALFYFIKTLRDLLFDFIKILKDYVLSYWLYIIVGIIVLFLLILFINLISKIEIKKQKKSIKWLITIFIIILVLLFIYLRFPIFKFDLSGILNSIKSFFINIWNSIKNIIMPVYDFLVVYINYIILGFVVLIILIFLMNLLGKEKKEKKIKEEIKKVEEKKEKKIKKSNKNKKTTKKISKRKRKKK